MDIYEYLKEDHQKVKRWFKLLSDTKNAEFQKEIFEQISTALRVHSKSEEDTFYQALIQKLPEMIHHAEKEHKEITDQMKKIEGISQHDAWLDAVEKLEEIVQHHVSEEEGKIFRKAKQIFSAEEAYTLKEQMHDRKEQLLLGGHPPRKKTTRKKVHYEEA